MLVLFPLLAVQDTVPSWSWGEVSQPLKRDVRETSRRRPVREAPGVRPSTPPRRTNLRACSAFSWRSISRAISRWLPSTAVNLGHLLDGDLRLGGSAVEAGILVQVQPDVDIGALRKIKIKNFQ